MKVIRINEPIWSKRAVGIAVREFPLDPKQAIVVEILYKNIHGRREFPNQYMVRWTDVKDNPRQMVRGVQVVIVRIGEMRLRG